MKKLEGKISLVTGASRGIGRSIALALAKEGSHVIALARTRGALEKLDDDIREIGGSATLVELNLKDYEGIDRLGATIFERWGKLDILVGNAAILGDLTPVNHITPNTWDDVIATNLTANYRLIRSMDLLLRQSDNAKALFIGSDKNIKNKPFWGVFNASKSALKTLVHTYREEVKNNTNISVEFIEPKATKTALRAKAYPSEDTSKLLPPDNMAQKIIEVLF
jgi:NAD(P)-dependent dehydrogenase (short-subunit alcohol dehydrogenase family)